MSIFSRLPFALAALLQESDSSTGIPWWVWALAFLVLLFLFWFFFIRDEIAAAEAAPPETSAVTRAPVVAPVAEAAPAVEAAPVAEAAPATEAAPAAKAPTAPQPEADVPAAPDDLRKIEGIGPKVSSLLAASGITTFAQLANSDVGRLQEILDAAGSRYRIINPETWPEQSALAASGDWEGLQALQDSLQGGRRAE